MLSISGGSANSRAIHFISTMIAEGVVPYMKLRNDLISVLKINWFLFSCTGGTRTII